MLELEKRRQKKSEIALEYEISQSKGIIIDAMRIRVTKRVFDGEIKMCENESLFCDDEQESRRISK